MDHANLARAFFPLHRLGKKTIQEGFNRNGLMNLEVGLNTVNDVVIHRFMNMKGEGHIFDL